MNDSLRICEALKSDLPNVLRLYAQPDLNDGKGLSIQDAESIFERISRYPNYKIYIAKYNEQIVGTFALLIMDNLGHRGAPSAIVEDVAVDPAFQSQGIGKVMMNDAVQRAAEKGC